MKNKEAIRYIEAYLAIDEGLDEKEKKAFHIAISALEKQEAEPAEMSWDINFGKIRPHCPVCGESNPMMAKYCFNCGQRIKVEEES